jgi:predicted ATPase
VTEVVGRDNELRTLREFIERRREGAAALVLDGEAGIGKTTLWRAGTALAAERRLRTLVAQPAHAERQLANAGLGDLLDGVIDESLPRLPTPRRDALEVALLRTEPSGSAPEPRAVGVAVVSVLASLADEGGLVIAVDDEQWLDASSASLLEFALRRLLDAPIALLVTRRTGEPGPRLERALGDERVEHLAVEPLSLGATHTLIRRRLGSSLQRPTLLRVHQTSGGNPFFALELARALDGAPID